MSAVEKFHDAMGCSNIPGKVPACMHVGGRQSDAVAVVW
jgi:hypothetical protein